MATTLSAGDIAIIGYNTHQTDASATTLDSFSFAALRDLDPGTLIFFTDRSWNGSSFVNGAGEGTFSYTVPPGGIAAGVVVTPALSGVDLSFSGDQIYAYQGTDANTPTSFLYAIEFGDSNNVFDVGGATLTGTGLTLGATAVAVALDSAAYSGPTTVPESHFVNGSTLLGSISDSTNWVGDNRDTVNAVVQPVQSGPFLTSPDVEIWAATAGGGDGVAKVDGDGTVSVGAFSFDQVRLYNSDGDESQGIIDLLYAPRDIAIDAVHGKFFITDSDISGGHNRVLQGNLSDLLANPSAPPAVTVLFSDSGTGTANQIRHLEIDPNNGLVYFSHGQRIDRVSYDTASQAATIVVNLGSGNPTGNTNNFVDDFVIDFAGGNVYASVHRVVSSSSGDSVTKNYVAKASGLTPTTTSALTYGLLPFSPQDSELGPDPSPLNGEQFPKELGSLEGLALSPDRQTLYFTTATVQLDTDGDSGFPGDGNPATTDPVVFRGGIYSYSLVANPNGTYTNIYQQVDDGNNSQTVNPGETPQGLLDDLEIDAVSGRWYVSDLTGDQIGAVNPPGDEGIWSGSLSGAAATFFAPINNVKGLIPGGFLLDHAPTLSATSANATFTEAATNPASGSVSRVSPISGSVASDADTASLNDQLAGAVVRISAGFLAGDELTVNLSTTAGKFTGTNISVASNANGVLVLTGADSFVHYQAVLNAVQYGSTSENPTNYGANTARSIAFSVTDGLVFSDEQTVTVTVAAANDAPVNAVGGAASGFEDSTIAVTGVSVSDLDADPAAQDITVTLSVANGTLSVGTSVAGGLSAGEIAGNSTTTVVLTGTQSQINATLAAAGGLSYTGNADFNGSDALTVTTNDNGYTGSSAATDVDVKTITVAAVNDAPSGTDASRTILEDHAYVFAAADFGFSDATEGGANGLAAVKIASLPGAGTLTNNGVGVAVGTFVSVADINAGHLVFAPAANASGNGYASFTFQVQDDGGTVNGGVDLDQSPNTFSFDVTPVSDAPAGANATRSIAEDTSYTFAAADFGFSDPSDIPPDTFISVEITTLPGAGSLSNNGSAVSPGEFVSAADINAGHLVFTPAADANGAGYGSFTFQVHDSGGTANGGADTDPTPNTFTLDVTAVNDAPVNTVPGGQSVNANTDLTFSAANGNAISVVDIDAGAGNLTVTLAVSHGTLTLASTAGLSFQPGSDGVQDATMTFSGTTSAINSTLNGLVYHGNAGFGGDDTLSITTSDNGNTGAGGALSDNDAVAIHVGAAPTDIVALTALETFEFTIFGLQNGDSVGRVQGVDPDSTTLTYGLVNDAGGRFAIDNSGTITVADKYFLDYEQNPAHLITVRVTDPEGQFLDKNFTVTVKDVNPEFVFGDGRGNTFWGGALNDLLFGSAGADELRGGGGNDTLGGGGGNDRLFGGLGQDRLDGGAGDDWLDGGAGVDGLTGGDGFDTFVFRRGETHGDEIVDFNGNGVGPGDFIRFEGYGTAADGATFVRHNSHEWVVTSADHTISETINFANSPVKGIVADDFGFF